MPYVQCVQRKLPHSQRRTQLSFQDNGGDWEITILNELSLRKTKAICFLSFMLPPFHINA